MVTIPLQLPNELARQIMPLQDRLPEIIELGLRQLAAIRKAEITYPHAKQHVLDALASTGIVTLPTPSAQRKTRVRRTPIKAGGLPASEMIVAERRASYE
ncbi:MAG: hypothetical protein WAW03_20700 [Anaerolineae bacterium]|uniref:hypothetical protein n=1 Tax=Candidatus Amarolinea dominans TaxID=3140696 RepID=UPI001D965F42|nr:hypothetical protein [Anaerolineae bacterium]MBK9092784.1 hypothetical protein [Anaerolineae bacterium]MBK9233472.1 hypothetical protein [Anaerolineae bacterium]